jgi:hypothetical protein
MVIPSFLFPIIIGFVARQITKFGDKTDWSKIKSDAAVRVSDLVPGDWFDDEAVSAVCFLIDKVSSVLHNAEAITNMVAALFDKDWQTAVSILRKTVCENFGVDQLSGLFHS